MTPFIEALVLAGDGAQWLHLVDPVAIVEADRPDRVQPALREAREEAERRGLHAVCVLQYEAGEAFGLSVVDRGRHESVLPLIWIALFSSDTVSLVEPPASLGGYDVGALETSMDRARFSEAVRALRGHIADGDIYQANYTFRLRGSFRGEPRDLFADLVGAQRGRYAAFVRMGGYAICSASPELFLSARDGRVVTRPMKGTARRGRTLAEDEAQATRLRASAKERAENVMVVDMMRNDLGRVASFGSVDVPELFALEPYPNVWQMTSTVTARVDAPLEDLVAATFPSASVTGAPKVRAMQILAALEPEPRGVYTGAIGYVAPDGDAQFNVAIRTAVVDMEAGRVEFGVGSGIVWDSDPDQEYDECLLKGSILGRRAEPLELLETLRWTPTEGWFLLERHLSRLARSARFFSYRCPLSDVRAALERAVAGADRPLRVRLLLSEDGGARVEHTALETKSEPLRLRVAKAPVDASSVFLFHKTTKREVYERARLADCDDVVLWNGRGEVTETTIANLVFEIDGCRVTPSVECGLLAGTFREELLAAASVVERVVTLAEARRADAVWLVNSVRGWCPAVLVEHDASCVSD
jgi:para-aminobenzoate synthetase/4-amino-4-deoxychorismate lyase